MSSESVLVLDRSCSTNSGASNSTTKIELEIERELLVVYTAFAKAVDLSTSEVIATALLEHAKLIAREHNLSVEQFAAMCASSLSNTGSKFIN